MPRILNIRGMDCPPELEEKFNKWYSETHIPMLMKNPQMKAATRFKRIGDDKTYPKYVAIYEFDSQGDFDKYNASPEIKAAIEESKQSWPKGGYESKWRVQYEEIKAWKKK